MYPLPALLTPLQLLPFTTEEITGCSNVASKGANNPFPVLTDLFPLIFLSNLFIAFEIKLLTNLCKLSLAKGIATFVRTFLP